MMVGLVEAASDVGRRATPDIPRAFRVVAREPETSDVVTLHVAPLQGGLPAFRPAQFSMIGVLGVGEVPISISSRGDDSSEHAYTLRRAGAVTNALADLVEGDVLTVRGPFGVPWDLDRCHSRHALFIAGGIGLAPLRAAIEEVVSLPPETRPLITLLVGARRPADLLYGPWVEGLRSRGVTVTSTIDASADGVPWGGAVGFVTDLVAPAISMPSLVEAYVCGPDAMMRAAIAEL